MSEMSVSSASTRRLRILRFGLIAVTAVAFALATGIGYIASQFSLGGALLQGLIWGAGTAVLSVIVYFVYKSVVVKA